MFTPAQLSAIRKVTLARILCDNGDNVTKMPADVFLNTELQKFKKCEDIPAIDLSHKKY